MKHQKNLPLGRIVSTAFVILLAFMLLFTWLPEGQVNAYTYSERTSLSPTDLGWTRERLWRAAERVRLRGNQTGYGYNHPFSGSSWGGLQNQGAFDCVRSATMTLYIATASKINSASKTVNETADTSHTYASSTGLVMTGTYTGALASDLASTPNLYKEISSGTNPANFKPGTIVFTGYTDESTLTHAMIVLGTITQEEIANWGIQPSNLPSWTANTVYLLSMVSGSAPNATFLRHGRLNTTFYQPGHPEYDATKGYYVKRAFEPVEDVLDIEQFGGFRFRKTDTHGNAIPGAVFQLNHPVGAVETINMISGSYTSNMDYSPGTYTLTETQAPPGHVLDPTPRTLVIEADEMNSVYWDTPITNSAETGRIRVLKRDASTHQVVEGAVFDLSQSSSFPASSTYRLTTGSDGFTPYQDFPVPLGTTVYVKEVSVPAPYIIDSTVKEATFVVNGTTTVTFDNQRAVGRFEIIKRSEEGQAIEGAVFEVKNANNSVVTTLTTGSNGKASTGELPLGTYTVQETFVPEPYIINRDPITVALTYANMNTPVVISTRQLTNETAKGQIEVLKKDKERGDLMIEGATFQLLDEDRNPAIDFDGNPVGPLITDSTGKARTNNRLRLGTYILKEVGNLPAYRINDTEYVIHIDYANMDTPLVIVSETVINDPIRAKIQIRKLAQGLAVPIEGVEFELLDEAGDPAVDVYGTPVGILVTDVHGDAMTPDLRRGQYTIKELGAPEEYYLSVESPVVTIDYDDDGKTLIQHIYNELIELTLRIRKTDAETGTPLANATFQVLDSDDNVITFKVYKDGVQVDTEELTTNAQGTVMTVSKLPIGLYQVVEIRTPDGYATMDPVFFTITRDTPYIVLDLPAGKTLDEEFENKPITVELSKKAITGEDELPGAHLQLFDKDTQELLDEWISTTEPHVIKRLLVGKTYILREMIAPIGYTLTTDVEFTVRDTGEVQTVTMRDDYTRVEVKKIDALTGDALEGVSFEVQDQEGNTLRFVRDDVTGAYLFALHANEEGETALLTDIDGKIVILGLPEGSYDLIEIKTNDGYKKLKDPIPFRVTDMSDETSPVVVNVENEPTEVIISKTDIAVGEPVHGAVIEIYDEQGELVRSIITDEAGNAKILGLKAGKYTFKEAFAPNGYVLNENTFEFVIDEYGDVTGATAFTNEPSKILIYKVDAQDSEKKLDGVVYQLFRIREGEEPELIKFRLVKGVYLADKEGDVVNLITNEKGMITAIALPFGEYKLYEMKALPGYVINPIGIEITLTGESFIYGQVVENGETVVILEKKDILTGDPISGVVIEVYDADGLLVRTVETDAEGKAVLIGLPTGSYAYKEVIVPPGYTIRSETQHFVINNDGSVDGDLVLLNEPTELILKKTSRDKNKPLEGAEYELYALTEKGYVQLRFKLVEGIYIPSEEGDITTLITGSDGTITVRYLPAGKYRIVEIKAPKGYIKSEEPIDVEIVEDKTPLYVTAINETEKPRTPVTGENMPVQGPILLGFSLLTAGLATLIFRKRKKANRQ